MISEWAANATLAKAEALTLAVHGFGSAFPTKVLVL